MSIIIHPARAQQKPSGNMYLSVNQLNIVHGTWTRVLLNAITSGFTDGIEDTTNHKITPGVAGYYAVFGNLTFTEVVATKDYYAGLKFNGTTFVRVSAVHSSVPYFVAILVYGHFYLTDTDYIELYCFHRAGVNTVDIVGSADNTFMSVQRVR